MIRDFYAHGKLLLTGEYFVLDGAKALALPTRLGQSLSIKIAENMSSLLSWKSYDQDGTIWFEGTFGLEGFKPMESSDSTVSKTLQNILLAVRSQNSSFLKKQESVEVVTRLEFPRLWGLGTSSTLIYNMAQWSQSDPFQLLKATFGGSGYDIACAGAKGPIFFQNTPKGPKFEAIDFNPPFKAQLYFVYLGKKQNSREGIRHYRQKAKEGWGLISKISDLTEKLCKTKELSEFEALFKKHEDLVSKTLELPKVQDRFFSDFNGTVKSLGAWGGDFVLVASDQESGKVQEYFNEKGFEVFLKYDDLIL